jgi:hypothetical protein
LSPLLNNSEKSFIGDLIKCAPISGLILSQDVVERIHELRYRVYKRAFLGGKVKILTLDQYIHKTKIGKLFFKHVDDMTNTPERIDKQNLRSYSYSSSDEDTPLEEESEVSPREAGSGTLSRETTPVSGGTISREGSPVSGGTISREPSPGAEQLSDLPFDLPSNTLSSSLEDSLFDLYDPYSPYSIDNTLVSTANYVEFESESQEEEGPQSYWKDGLYYCKCGRPPYDGYAQCLCY